MEWLSAQSGKVPRLKMACPQVLMAMVSSRTPIRFIRKPVRICNGTTMTAGGPLCRQTLCKACVSWALGPSRGLQLTDHEPTRHTSV